MAVHVCSGTFLVGHPGISYTGRSCPLCEALRERDKWKAEAKRHEDHVDELMTAVFQLEHPAKAQEKP